MGDYKGDMRQVFENHCCYRRLPIIAFLSLINLPDTSFEVEFEDL
jgi:hypothetical protein